MIGGDYVSGLIRTRSCRSSSRKLVFLTFGSRSSIKVSEGGRSFSWSLVGGAAPTGPKMLRPSREPGKYCGRYGSGFRPAWTKWCLTATKSRLATSSPTFFANFLLDNVDLVRQLEDSFRDLEHVPLDPILSELERRAQRWG